MSVQLKDKTKQVPNGLRFLQPETGWDSTVALKSPSLAVITNALIQHRLGNPFLVAKHHWATEYKAVENEVARYNAEICLAHGWNSYIVGDQAIPVSPPPHVPQNAGASFAGSLKRTTSGIKLVKDWLGEGLQPVDKELAEKRAGICVTCSQNQLGDWWQRLEAMAAHKVKTLMAIKSDLDLSTSHEKELHSCALCDCHLPLKTLVPLKHILDHTPSDLMEKYPEHCWIKRLDQ